MLICYFSISVSYLCVVILFGFVTIHFPFCKDTFLFSISEKKKFTEDRFYPIRLIRLIRLTLYNADYHQSKASRIVFDSHSIHSTPALFSFWLQHFSQPIDSTLGLLCTYYCWLR